MDKTLLCRQNHRITGRDAGNIQRYESKQESALCPEHGCGARESGCCACRARPAWSGAGAGEQQGTSHSPATGPSTGPTSSPIATAQQQLYSASGTNGAQATQDSFQGSVVEGKSTGSVMDLSLDEAIQRGLRQNLGLILQIVGAEECGRPAAGRAAGAAADRDRLRPASRCSRSTLRPSV